MLIDGTKLRGSNPRGGERFSVVALRHQSDIVLPDKIKKKLEMLGFRWQRSRKSGEVAKDTDTIYEDEASAAAEAYLKYLSDHEFYNAGNVKTAVRMGDALLKAAGTLEATGGALRLT